MINILLPCSCVSLTAKVLSCLLTINLYNFNQTHIDTSSCFFVQTGAQYARKDTLFNAAYFLTVLPIFR
ncbi:hypothetical protein CW304_21680 [Bacillus sp. UFRGS-B20]|nr:hypothetical protein CW304_21680 [Bacillus sp. UFRGS-B20]